MLTVGESGDLEVTLIDFNVSKRFRDEETCQRLLLMTNTGAAAFIAPEVHNQQDYEYDHIYNLKSIQ